MTNLKKILTTLPAAALKINNQRLRLTAFRCSFNNSTTSSLWIQSWLYVYTRPVSTFYYGLDPLRLVMRMTSEKGNQISEELWKNYSEVELKSRISLSHLSVKLLEMKRGKKCLSGFLFRCCINTCCTSIILSCCGILSSDLRLVSSM